jgi:hypothetical protein
MKIRYVKAGVAGSVFLVLLLAGVARAGMTTDTTVESFESSLNVDASTGVPTRETTPAPPTGGGTYVVQMTNGSVTVNVTGQPQNAWVQLFGRPAGFENEPNSSDYEGAAAVFYVTTGNVLRARNGASWDDLATGVSTGAWQGFVVHLDYANDQWDMYRITSGSASYEGQTLTRLNGTAMSFADGNTLHSMSNITVTTAATAEIDALRLTPGNSSAGNSFYASIVPRQWTATTSATYIDAVPEHSESSPDNTLGGELGEALGEGLSNTDQATLYKAITPAYVTSTFNNGSWSGGDTALQLPAGSTVWFDYSVAKTALYRYFAKGLDPQAEQQTTQASQVLDVQGDDDPASWTPYIYLGVAKTAPAAGFTANAAGVGIGGSLYIKRDTYNYDRYVANGTGYTLNGENATPNLASGTALWIHRIGNGLDITVDLD